MVRSVLLRGFDQEMAENVAAAMSRLVGCGFVRGAVPVSVSAPGGGGGRYAVSWKDTASGEIREVRLREWLCVCVRSF